MIKNLLTILFLAVVIFYGVPTWGINNVHAQQGNKPPPANTPVNTPPVIPITPPAKDKNKDIIPYSQPLNTSIEALIQRIINVLFSLIATISVIFIIVGGFRLALSQGNQEAVASGKKTITWALAGLVVGLLAFTLVRVVIRLLY